MNDRIGIIDLGTNTFHLLLAEFNGSEYVQIYRERSAVRLGQRGINQGKIQPDAIERAVTALTEFKKTIDQYGVNRIISVGTSALRNASNANEITTKIKETTGIDIIIISGEREAELIFRGVQSALQLGKETSLVMDIGGGSVEFIIGNEETIFWKQSFEIGAQRLLEEFQKNDPITKEEITSLDGYFEKMLASIHEALAHWNPTTLVGSSGTFDTLSDIYCLKQGVIKRPSEAENPLTISGFYEIYYGLLHKDRNERMLIPGMIEMRVDMIVVASCLVRYLLERHNFTSIRVSTFALKEGILASIKTKESAFN